MSMPDEFDRTLERWLRDSARPAAPAGLLERVLGTTERRRPRPALVAALGSRWGSAPTDPVGGVAIAGRTGVRGPVVVVLLIALALALATGAVLVGARFLQPTPIQPEPGLGQLGHLAYALDDGLYVANWDGTGSRRILSLDRLPGPEQCRAFFGGPQWSPDGRHLAIRTAWDDQCAGHLIVTDAAGSSVTALPAAGWSIEWSRDSGRLVTWVALSESIGVYGLDGELVVLLAAPEGLRSGDHDPSWTPDGAAVLVPDGIVVPLDGSTPYTDPTLEQFFPRDLVSPDGTLIAQAGNREIRVDATDGSSRHTLTPDVTSQIFNPAWSPTGDRIAFQSGGSIGIIEVSTEATSFVDGPPGEFRLERFSPDGERFLISTPALGTDGAGGALWSLRTDGSHLQRLVDGTADGDWQWLRPDVSTPTPEPSRDAAPTASRRNGESIVFGQLGTGPGWDLAAQDIETGALRKIVETDGIVDCPSPCSTFVRRAEWSPDGSAVAFQVSHVSVDGPLLGPCVPAVGIWVASGQAAPRQLTTPCATAAATEVVRELWAWSPDGGRIAVARADEASSALSVVDVETGERTSMAAGVMDLASLDWSPDGTEVAYADRDSAYRVAVDGGAPVVLTDLVADVVLIDWSPDGSRILVHDQGRSRILVMDADGSDPRVILEGADACCSTAWSPSGDRILYMLSVDRRDRPGVEFDSEVWTIAPDGSDAIQIFASDGCSMGVIVVGDALPVWDPGGGRVAYNHCGAWVVANADGSGTRGALGGADSVSGGTPLRLRSWSGGGLTQWDLELIGQRDR